MEYFIMVVFTSMKYDEILDHKYEACGITPLKQDVHSAQCRLQSVQKQAIAEQYKTQQLLCSTAVLSWSILVLHIYNTVFQRSSCLPKGKCKLNHRGLKIAMISAGKWYSK